MNDEIKHEKESYSNVLSLHSVAYFVILVGYIISSIFVAKFNAQDIYFIFSIIFIIVFLTIPNIIYRKKKKGFNILSYAVYGYLLFCIAVPLIHCIFHNRTDYAGLVFWGIVLWISFVVIQIRCRKCKSM